MSDTKVTPRLAMRWVPVVDARGRTRMEMRWAEPATTAAADPRITHAA